MFDETRFFELLKDAVRAVLNERDRVQPNSADEYLTQGEAARYLQVSTATIRNFHRKGLKVKRVGRAARYLKRDLDALESQAEASDPAAQAAKTWEGK